MEITGFGAFRSFDLPEDWVEDMLMTTSIMTIKALRPAAHPDVEISFFKPRGRPDVESFETFRLLLEGPPHRLEEGTKVLPKISGLLGNVGNNQWTNPKGLAHTGFRLGLVETIDLQTRNALLLNGTFLQPEDKKSITEYCGIFVDVPNKLEIEQVYLQVPSTVGVLQFEKYKKTFMTLLRSVCWS